MFQSALETALRQTMLRAVRPMLNPRIGVPLQRLLVRQAYHSSRPPAGCRFETTSHGEVPVTRVSHASSGGDVVLYFHGGGYVLGSAATHRGLTGHLAKASGATLIVPDYRLAPEHPYPAAVEDAMAVYQALLNNGIAPGRIALAGDSAGGGLSLALAMRLRDEGQPMPASLTLFSPWTDLTNSQLTAPDCEPVLTHGWIDKAARLYVDGESATTPLISPVYGDLTGLPPMLIQVGSQEILLNDAQRLADRALNQGVDTTLEIYNSLWHVFQVHAGQLHRATDAVATAGQFIRRTLTQ
ncbi:MAG: alpha/beta hydrolase [Marinobacter sp.]|uniref:alpha/beta hydrolase n=1 Tax=Marinobacter sp. TaxID=50741 RepID=UPI00299D166A|nr:alpha/beta hydrolase [Marinobacter sp.]MDX1635119.1 alpha/beta hydrolase [Marinobacter sp.]